MNSYNARFCLVFTQPKSTKNLINVKSNLSKEKVIYVMLISCPFSHRKGIMKKVFLKTVTTFGAQAKKVCIGFFDEIEAFCHELSRNTMNDCKFLLCTQIVP